MLSFALAGLLSFALLACAQGQPQEDLLAQVDPAARCYVDAVNNENLDALVNCFSPDGAVMDVSREIGGYEAIRVWAEREVIGGTLEVLDVEPVEDGQRLLVYWAPEGSDGWQAHYTFTVQGGLIALADLQYA